MTKPAKRTPRLKFQSKLESISDVLEYYAIPVPAKITAAVGTRAAVPISASVNGSAPFLVSMAPFGGGQHMIRVKRKVRGEVNLKEGDRVRVEITVIDRESEAEIPADMLKILRAENALADFRALPKGQARYLIRLIDEAARPETRRKRIADAIEEAREYLEKRRDRGKSVR